MQRQDAANLRTTQRVNRLRVLNCVRFGRGVSRLSVTDMTGLSTASMSNIVTYLTKVGLVEESGVENVERIGRKGRLLSFRGDAYRFVTVSLAGRLARLYLTDLLGSVLASLEYVVGGLAAQTTVGILRDGILQLMGRAPQGSVLAVGVSVSGMVLQDGDCVVSTGLGWDMVNLRGALSQAVRVPVIVTNTTFTKALWLCRGGLSPAEDAMFFEMDHGMGGAIIRNGGIARSMVMELGHIGISPDGEDGAPGQCLEAACGVERTLARYREASGKEIFSPGELSQRLAKGDPAAKAAVDGCARLLGMALANAVNLFSPERLVIDDADYAQCPQLLEKAEEIMGKRALSGLSRMLKVEKKRFEPSDLPQSLAFELCGIVFSENYGINIFDQIGGNA